MYEKYTGQDFFAEVKKGDMVVYEGKTYQVLDEPRVYNPSNNVYDLSNFEEVFKDRIFKAFGIINIRKEKDYNIYNLLTLESFNTKKKEDKKSVCIIDKIGNGCGFIQPPTEILGDYTEVNVNELRFANTKEVERYWLMKFINA